MIAVLGRVVLTHVGSLPNATNERILRTTHSVTELIANTTANIQYWICILCPANVPLKTKS